MVKVVPLYKNNASPLCQFLDDEQLAIKLTCESGQKVGIWTEYCFSLCLIALSNLLKINIWVWFHKW